MGYCLRGHCVGIFLSHSLEILTLTDSILPMSENITDLSADSFDSAIAEKGLPVLVDFWAPWCGPCKMIAPILEELATEANGKIKICKVNVDNNSQLANRFQIRAIPTLLLFRDGKVETQIVGMTSKEDLKKKAGI
ncbi:MAG: thioredoxin [Opitutales bacterium]|nr:thioredoxin [Opitutales bacterium]